MRKALFVATVLASAQPGTVTAQTTAQAKTTRQSAPPAIILDQAQPEIFPDKWHASPVSARATLLDEKERQRSKDIVERALAKYPPEVVTGNLRKVYVVGQLEYFGVATGGTNSRNAVYVANNGRYASIAIERVFHAEFSSILLRNHPAFLDQEAWQKINPPGFHYLGNGVQAIREGKAGQGNDDALHRDGFIVQYSQSSLENDFNSIADRLFTGDAAFWLVAGQYPKLMAKADLVIAFYTKLDASFAKEWFLAMRSVRQPSRSAR